MTVKRLGKGIGAIIPTFPEAAELLYRIADIATDSIRANPHQPRKQFNEEPMQELIGSIREKGIIQPITVRQTENGFELIAGERRWRAAQQLGMPTVPAYVLPVKSDVEMMELALIENVQREDLNPIEEAEGYAILANTFDLSHEEIAAKVGKTRPTITNALRLLNLPEPIIRDLRNGELTAGHARPILALSDQKQQLNLWRRIKRDGLSVRSVETIVKNCVQPKTSATTPTPTKPAYIRDIEQRLMHITGSRVRLRGQESSGFIEIEYYSTEDLNRLLEMFESIEDH